MKVINRYKRICLCLIAFLSISNLSLSQSQFKRAGDYYALERNGTLLTGYVFTEVSTFIEGKAWVNKGELYGYIDTLGQPITLFEYADVSAFNKGYAIVSKDTLGGHFGVINHTGYEICKLKYSRAHTFSNGIAPVLLDSVWGLLDTFGRELITPQYDYPPIVVSASFIVVSKQGKWGVINRKGAIVYDFKYDLITEDGVAFIANEKVYLGLL